MKTFMALAMIGLGFLAIAPSGPAMELSSTTQDALATTVLHHLTSGANANVGWGDALSTQFLQVFVDTTGVGTNGVPNAVLAYNALAYDPTSQVCTDDPLFGSFCYYTRVTFDFADAFIDPNDFRVTANTARLDTDLTHAIAISFSHCVHDEVAGTTVCTDVPASGLIHLAWSRTMGGSFRQMGITERTTGPETVRVSGTVSRFSANTNGTMLGKVVTDRPGSIGTSQGVTIDILRTQ